MAADDPSGCANGRFSPVRMARSTNYVCMYNSNYSIQ